jgi:hypothetical protein
VVIERVWPLHQFGQALQQVFEPQVGADALVEGVFVQYHWLIIA